MRKVQFFISVFAMLTFFDMNSANGLQNFSPFFNAPAGPITCPTAQSAQGFNPSGGYPTVPFTYPGGYLTAPSTQRYNNTLVAQNFNTSNLPARIPVAPAGVFVPATPEGLIRINYDFGLEETQFVVDMPVDVKNVIDVTTAYEFFENKLSLNVQKTYWALYGYLKNKCYLSPNRQYAQICMHECIRPLLPDDPTDVEMFRHWLVNNLCWLGAGVRASNGRGLVSSGPQQLEVKPVIQQPQPAQALPVQPQSSSQPKNQKDNPSWRQ